MQGVGEEERVYEGDGGVDRRTSGQVDRLDGRTGGQADRRTGWTGGQEDKGFRFCRGL